MPIIQALDRALKIIDLFDEHNTELKITEISKRLQLHKSTVHSLLKTLMLHGYITQDEESNKYKLGMKFVEKGHLLLQGLDIRTETKPFLQELSERTGQTTHLVILSGNEGVYIDKIEGEKAVIRYSYLGRKVPLHSSACGKVLLAYQKETVKEKILSNYKFTRQTAMTIMDKERLERALQEVRQLGYAVDNQENEPGVRCIAAPVLNYSGEIVAAISLSTLVSSVDDELLGSYRELLCFAALQVSQRLGYKLT